MALQENCVPYQRGEIVPLIFRVYTESGIPFTAVPDPDHDGNIAYCDLMDEEGKHLQYLPASIIEDAPAEKKFIVSWNTGNHSVAYYRLQLWATVNVSGKTDNVGDLLIEGRLASEELLRYIRD